MNFGFDDVEQAKIRDDFPVLNQKVHGKPLVYLDNAATSQKPRQVIGAITDYYERYNANVHRGIHALAERATREYETAREKVARFINAGSTECVIYTRGTTEAINLVAYSWARTNLKKGDEILITWMEHHSNIVPWYQVAEATGAVIKRIPLNDDGTLRLDDLDTLITEHTKLVAITQAFNVLGTIDTRFVSSPMPPTNKARSSSWMARKAVPHLAVDVQALDADFFVFSGHKMCGPTASGVLYGRKKLLEAMPPFFGGGEMIREVRADGFTCNDLPYKFEAGTPNIAEVELASASRWIICRKSVWSKIRQHEKDITQYALERLKEIIEAKIYGPLDVEKRGGLVAFTFSDIHPHDLATFFDQEGIAIRAGHHCAMPLLHKHLNIGATARASFYLYNTRDEVDTLVATLQKAKNFFGACPTGRALASN